MKTNQKWGVVLITSICLAACTPKQQTVTSYTISGTINGLADSTTLVLVPITHDNEKPVAETKASNGTFSFNGTAEDTICVRLAVKDTYGGINLMLENAEITVNGNATSDKAHDGTPLYHFDNVEIKGSPMTDHYTRLMSVRDSMDVLYQAYHDEYAAIERQIVQAREKKDQKALEALYKSDEYKAFSAAEGNFFKTMAESYNKIILDNKDSFWGPLMMVSLSNYLTPDQKEIYEQFSEAAKESYYGKKVKEELYPAGMVGQPVRAFTVKDAEGKEVTLASLLEGKKYALIDFWASWCGSCRKEIPNLKNLYKKYADKGFQIISISIDKKEEDWQKALKEEGLTWPNFCDREVADLYKVKAVPTMYLVDAKGILAGQDLRGKALADKLEELFGK